MKKINTLIVILFTWGCNYAQSKPEVIIESFIHDLKSGTVSNKELIRKYFSFEGLNKNEREEMINPILSKQLDLIKQKIIEDCSTVKVIAHDLNSDFVKSHKLETDNLKESSIFYVTCGDEIITPFLIEGTKFLSISVYSKTENGNKKFVVY